MPVGPPTLSQWWERTELLLPDKASKKAEGAGAQFLLQRPLVLQLLLDTPSSENLWSPHGELSVAVIKCPRQNTTLNEKRVTLAHGFRVLRPRSLGSVAFMAMTRMNIMVAVWVEESSFLHGGQEPKKDGQGARVSLRICPNNLLLVIHFLKLSKPYNSTTGWEPSLPHKGLWRISKIQIVMSRPVRPMNWGWDVLWPQRPICYSLIFRQRRQWKLGSKQSL